MYKWPIFVFVSAGIGLLSWAPLHDRRSHGFYRFFAFEAILALILLNLDRWFKDALSAVQLISWLLLLASILLAVHGFHLLRVIGQPAGSFENTSTLVRVGAYRYIRHPLYSSLLCLAWGAFLKAPSLPGGIFALTASGALIATARVEEAECVRKFGADYTEYMSATRMFIPFLF